MSCPYCRREGPPEPSPATGTPAANPASPAGTLAAPAASPSSPKPPSAPPSHKGFRAARKTVGKTARKTGWLFPGILLVLMPKCPICLAAYIALVTGISIPITAATWLRGSLLAGCIGALVWLAVRWSLYLYRRYVH